MAYISTSHSVGDIVYAYDHDTDSVQRLRVVSLTAKSKDCQKYGGGSWDIEYQCQAAQCFAGDEAAVGFYDEDALHESAREAFPAIRPAAEPALPEVTETETA